jgi:hypothetical protein
VTPESELSFLGARAGEQIHDTHVALERDMDADQLDDMDARTGYYKKKTTIGHPINLNGMIYRFYVKSNLVRKINFLMLTVVRK